ncbi:MAG: hypothetical protein H7836_17805 [Magnetococcus sp. YQC-3]
MFSGSKFTNLDGLSRTGLHGVGLVVVNALSEWMEVSIRKKDKFFSYSFSDSKIINQTTYDCNLFPQFKWSTFVKFKPYTKYFKDPNLLLDEVKKKLFFVAAKFPNSNIFLNGEKIKNLDFEIFCKALLGIENEVVFDKISYIDDKKQKIELVFTYEENSKAMPTILGDVNLNFCSGTYLSTIQTLFFKIISEIVNDERLTKSDVFNQFRLYCSLTILEPEFQGQTKERLSSNVGNIISQLYTGLKAKLNTFSLKERFKSTDFSCRIFLLRSLTPC